MVVLKPVHIGGVVLSDVTMLVVDSNPNFTNAASEAFEKIGIASKVINSAHQGRNFLISRGNEATMCVAGVDPNSHESEALKYGVVRVCMALEIPYIVAEQLPGSRVRLSAFKFWNRGHTTSFLLTGNKSEINFWFKLWDVVIVAHGATHDSSRCVEKPRHIKPEDWQEVIREKQRDAWSPFNIPHMLAWQKLRREHAIEFGAEIYSSRIKKFF